MKEPYRYDPASQPDPESCAGDRKVAGEALTGVHAGQPLSSEITESGVPTQSACPRPEKFKQDTTWGWSVPRSPA